MEQTVTPSKAPYLAGSVSQVTAVCNEARKYWETKAARTLLSLFYLRQDINHVIEESVSFVLGESLKDKISCEATLHVAAGSIAQMS